MVWRGIDWNSPWWWGVIQAFFLRPSPETAAFISSVERNWGVAPNFAADVSLHIRVGGKLERPKSVTPELYLESAYQYIRYARTRQSGPCARRAEVFVATDSPEVLPVVEAWAASHADDLIVRMQSNTATQKNAKGHRETAPTRGHDQYQAAIEIITDIFFLSRSRVFFGMYCSQIARAAAAIGHAHGTLRDAIALDMDAPDAILNASAMITKYSAGARWEGWRARSHAPRPLQAGACCSE